MNRPTQHRVREFLKREKRVASADSRREVRKPDNSLPPARGPSRWLGDTPPQPDVLRCAVQSWSQETGSHSMDT